MRKNILYVMIVFIVSLFLMSCFAKPFTHEKVIFASDKAAYGSFGFFTSLSGEYLIVGAATANSLQGQVYIFKHNENNDWDEIAKLEASDKSKRDNFGYCVAASGNYIIVGAPGCQSKKGQVYVFKKDEADNWKEGAILTSPSPIEQHFFGCSVSIDGDYAIVGANSVGKDMGAAYVFKNDGAGNWKEIERFTSGNNSTDDNFGYSVSISGDYAIVGAPSANSGGNKRGEAYIFKNDGVDQWNPIALLTASDQADDDAFGRSVSISGDYVIIGAPSADSGSKDRGQAYIYKNDGAGNWMETVILKTSDESEKNFFGHSVAASGSHVIVAAPGSNSEKGLVYIFKNIKADNWKEINILKPGDKTEYIHFGTSVSLSENYAVSSTLTKITSREGRGQVYIYY
jgi:hypothetical protein